MQLSKLASYLDAKYDKVYIRDIINIFFFKFPLLGEFKVIKRGHQRKIIT